MIYADREAIDEIIRVRADEFSRIQAPFQNETGVYLLPPVDEGSAGAYSGKKPDAAKELERQCCEQNDSVLRNPFSFSGLDPDIKANRTSMEFCNFPFVPPYQSIIMQKVLLNQARKSR